MSCHAAAGEASIERGRYMVAINGCNDCHTPGYLHGRPEMARHLAGSDVGFEVPGQTVTSFLFRILPPGHTATGAP